MYNLVCGVVGGAPAPAPVMRLDGDNQGWWGSRQGVLLAAWPREGAGPWASGHEPIIVSSGDVV